MVGTVEATKIYAQNKGGAWYLTEGAKNRSYVPGLTIPAQIIIGASKCGPGVTERELIKYKDLTHVEIKQALIELLERELVLSGPVEDWMLDSD